MFGRCLRIACLLFLLVASRGNCLDLSAFHLKASDPHFVSPLPSAPTPLRSQGEQAIPIEVRSDEDLVKVNFSPAAVLKPWFGAGIDFDNPPNLGGTAEIKVGLGLDYRPRQGLRFNLGWRYQPKGGWEMNRWLENPDLEERHRFSFGLETSF